jgi:hypothetical protein
MSGARVISGSFFCHLFILLHKNHKMKKLNFRQINGVMGKDHTPLQKKFIKSDNIQLNSEGKLERMPRKPFSRARKPNNNDPCPCGSGRKFKLCCKITSS